ncbi:hypothetical protein D5F01_LYC14272 [Larimichthys crocea]|uniref:Uncharacterized protein n=1 Tax=Larimichthys crocea TaxID=215358 RepID=A0A6G0I9U4_LARCR|nr:hypothetical protein D5F01_LYC14272 [Larimichthys crocea]
MTLCQYWTDTGVAEHGSGVDGPKCRPGYGEQAAGLLEGGQTGPGSVFLRVLRCSPVFLPNVGQSSDGGLSSAEPEPLIPLLGRQMARTARHSPDPPGPRPPRGAPQPRHSWRGTGGVRAGFKSAAACQPPCAGRAGHAARTRRARNQTGGASVTLTDLFVRKQADSVQNPEHSDPPEPDPDPRARPRPRPPEPNRTGLDSVYCV